MDMTPLPSSLIAKGMMYVTLIPTTLHELQQHIIETFTYVAHTGRISLSGHL
jgi:hypothetical protein